jgi:hypothetical protein
METIIFDEEYLKLYYNPAKNQARAVWNGFVSGNIFHRACIACQDLMDERKVLYWLADNRKMKSIRAADQEWFMKEIVPRICASPLRKMATLVSEDIFNQMAIDLLFIKKNHIIRFDNHYFKNEEEALVWLAQDEFIQVKEG